MCVSLAQAGEPLMATELAEIGFWDVEFRVLGFRGWVSGFGFRGLEFGSLGVQGFRMKGPQAQSAKN